MIKHGPSDNYLDLFAKTLMGALDPTLARYIQVVNDTARTIPWPNSRQIVKFMALMFPYLRVRA